MRHSTAARKKECIDREMCTVCMEQRHTSLSLPSAFDFFVLWLAVTSKFRGGRSEGIELREVGRKVIATHNLFAHCINFRML